MIIPVAVEKLAHSEFAKIGSRQEAPQTILLSLLDIFYHPNFGFLLKKRVFQQPPLLPTPIRMEGSDWAAIPPVTGHVRPIGDSWIDLIWRAATMTCTVPHKI